MAKVKNQVFMKLNTLFVLFTLFVFETSMAKPFTMGGDIDPPLKWLDENDQPVGIEIDLLTAIYQKMPDLVPKFKFIIYKSSPRSKQALKDGTLDQYITMSHKKKRMEYLLYPSESHLNIKWLFFTTHRFLLKQQELGKPVLFNHYQDLSSYRIGATQDYAYSEEFWSLAKSGKLNVEVMQKNKLNIKKLLAGRIDLFPSYQFKMQWNAQQGGYDKAITYLPKAIRDKQYFNPFSKASTQPQVQNGNIIRRYDKILRSMKQKGLVKKILQKYGVN